MILHRRTALLGGLALPMLAAAPALAVERVSIGQATPALSFLPLWAARAYQTFAPVALSLNWAAIPGGDPAALAALDAGDIDLAAVGSDTALAAIAKHEPFLFVYSLMSKMTLQVVVSDKLLKRTGVGPKDPVANRIRALKGAIVGVSAVGGTQDRVARWVAAQGGLNPQTGIQVAMVGPPPAIQAAMENNRIDAFVLSPPEAGVAEARGYGKLLIDPNADFPALRGLPNLVLVAKRNPDAAAARRIAGACRAMTLGAQKVTADPDQAADKIQAQFFSRIPQPIVRSAVHSMLDGLAGGGRFTTQSIGVLTRFSRQSGTPVPSGKDYWTNRFIAA
jgi:NitT/TauT family transport system substrate-binding protein